jgi:hypothetical protein
LRFFEPYRASFHKFPQQQVGGPVYPSASP